MERKIAIAGASGFIGKALTHFLEERSQKVIALTRKEGCYSAMPCDVVINLAGENIFGRWTKEKKQEIKESRLKATASLVDSIQKLPHPPALYIGASAVGYYGHDRGEEILTESSAAGKDFLAEVCLAWEEEAAPLSSSMRVLHPRFGTVVSKEGGALRKMLPLFELGLGGTLGSGAQWMSWIALEDLLEALWHLITQESHSGAFNFVSPHSVTNRQWTRTLAAHLHRIALLPVPRFALTLAYGAFEEVLLGSLHVYPERLLASGYTFRLPYLKNCLPIKV